ncbi:acyl carrier protein [Streptomyces sp. V4-01]|uniref:Acyl carrier protein n=1 Tax=Actinacidiphila polyblastidii TaxID=3110430 RepID=A0ABU7PID6_9ACTN|nr:acyl carrier protein [Streptomyces sp. V4-01]
MTAPQTEQHQDLRAQLVRLIIESSDGDLSRTEVDAAAGSLRDLGYSSLSYIRLIDGIENELGVYIDPDADAESFATLDRLVGLVQQSREGSGG